jgi:plastocyanin
MHKRLFGFSSFVVLVLASSCGGGGSDTTTTEPPGPAVSIVVGAPSSTVIIGSTLQLSTTAKDAKGAIVTTGVPAASWTSSNAAIASVDAASGLVSGKTAGSVTITATAGSLVGTKTLSVAQATTTASVTASTALDFDPAQVDIVAGGTVTWQFQSTAHNVTFNTTGGGTPTNIGDTSNGNVSRTFATAGTFPYRCTLHAGMNGTVVVH